MNKCRYCKKEITKTEIGWNICECEKAQIEWSIQIKIQEYKKYLNQLNKELHELRDDKKNIRKSN